MAENFIFRYKNKEQHVKDYVFDFKELKDKFILSFGLEKDMQSQLKFYVDGKEINQDDDLELIKPDNIIEVKNVNEETKIENEAIGEKEKLIEKEAKTDNNEKGANKDYDSKDIDLYLSEKLEENIQKLERNIIEKNEEKIQSLKAELFDAMDKKINTMFAENEISKKMLDIDNKINKLNQDYIDFKSIKIKYFNKFIEVFDNKFIPQDSAKNEQSESSSKNEESDKLKDQNERLKTMVKKLRKEKDEMKDKFEKELSKKANSDDISPQLENFKKENEKLKVEKENLNNTIKNLENELKKKSASSSLSSSTTAQKKYNGKLINKKDNTYQYDEILENETIELNLTIKNMGGDDLPKNCEILLLEEVNGLNIEKFKTKNFIKESEEITIKFKVDLNIIEVNKDIDVKLKLVDDNKKDIAGAKCKLNIKIIKEEKSNEDKGQTTNNTITLEENDYKDLYNHIDNILQIETMGEDMSSFKAKLSELLDKKKTKYENIAEKTEYIESLKEDLEEIFQ